MDLTKFSTYEKEHFKGVDASLEISLFEYGIVWKQTKEDEYLFVYGVNVGNQGNYISFDHGYMDKTGFESLIHEEWFELDKVLDFTGVKRLSFPGDIFDCIQYYGYENIFGSCYNPITIERDDL